MHRLLIVDDDPAVQAEVAAIAGEEGLHSRVAQRFQIEEALEHWRPDIVLLDIVMPEVEGMEVLRLMAGANGHVPVILASAFADYVGLAQRLAVAADVLVADAVPKPFTGERIRAALRTALAARVAAGRGGQPS